MKRAVIIHCWNGDPEYCWYPKTKADLEAAGVAVSVPQMPTPEAPNLVTWLSSVKHVVGTPDKDLILIGHSVGCITILRYLEQLQPTERVRGVILVAGYTYDLGFSELRQFFEAPINFALIQEKAEHITIISSDNDQYVPQEEGKKLQRELAAHLIVKHNMGHFSGPKDDEEMCLALPDLTKSAIKMFAH